MVLIPVLSAIAVGFLGFAIYLDRTERTSRIEEVDEELSRAERAGLPRLPNGGGAGGAPDAALADGATAGAPVQLLVDADGQVLVRAGADSPFDDESLERFASLLQARHTTLVTDNGSNHRVLITGAAGDARQVTALPLDSVDEAMAQFRRSLVFGGLIIAALVAAVVWLVTTAVTRPVMRLSQKASVIADGELDASVEMVTGSREVIELAANFDSMVTRLQSALATSEQSATDAVEARDDMRRFLADVSHELRTPLTALKGYSDLYAVGALETTEDVDRAMSRIGSESERLTSLTTEMLALARDIPADEMATAFDVSTVVAGVVDDVRAAQPEQTVETDLAADLVITGAPGRIHQVVLNLATNACQHGASEHGVLIRTRRAGSDIEVSVVDHGPGISEGDEGRIFLPLYRAESSRARQGVGSAGLGLAVSQRIAEDHGGTLDIGRTTGGGATFTLRLPAAPMDTTPGNTSEPFRPVTHEGR